MDELDGRGISVGIIGAGIAGSSCALQLLRWRLKNVPVFRVFQFEKKSEVCDGLPYCHAHAGGLLYTSSQISDSEAISLLRQTLVFIQTFPASIIWRPTVIAIRQEAPDIPTELVRRCHIAQAAYAQMNSSLLGDPNDYFRSYSKQEITELQQAGIESHPKSLTHWMQNFASLGCDMDSVKWPVVIAREPGISVVSVAAIVELSQQRLAQSWILKLNSEVTAVIKVGNKWRISYFSAGRLDTIEVDFLINAAGNQSGLFDVQAGEPLSRLFELKANYLVRCDSLSTVTSPELVFLGSRAYKENAQDRPACFVQLTPYRGGVWQVHAMAGDATVFEEGVVSSHPTSSAPCMTSIGSDLEARRWPETLAHIRSSASIQHASLLLPRFGCAVPLPCPPLGGYQQIPSLSPEQRVAAVRLNLSQRYAALPVVKAVAAPQDARELASSLVSLFYPHMRNSLHESTLPVSSLFSQREVLPKATNIAIRRHLPSELTTYTAHTTTAWPHL